MSIIDRAIGATIDATAESELSIDDAAEALSVERRRFVIEDLAIHGRTDLRSLTDRLATEQYGPGWGGADRKREYVPLYQSHLPKLDDYDIVEWDSDRGTIQQGPAFGAARETLEAVKEVLE